MGSSTTGVGAASSAVPPSEVSPADASAPASPPTPTEARTAAASATAFPIEASPSPQTPPLAAHVATLVASPVLPAVDDDKAATPAADVKVATADVEHKEPALAGDVAVAAGETKEDTPAVVTKESAPAGEARVATPPAPLGNVIVRMARAVATFFSDLYHAGQKAKEAAALNLLQQSSKQVAHYVKLGSGESKVGSSAAAESKEVKGEAKEVKGGAPQGKLLDPHGNPMEIDGGLLTAKPEAKKDHALMARLAAKSGLPTVADQDVGCGVLKAGKLNPDGTRSIVPTSYLKGADGDSEKVALSKGLTNVYTIVVEGKPYAVIRSGVIDTPERAEEFKQALIDCREQILRANPEKPADFQMRVVSQQLNSFEVKKEAKMIDSQHMYMARVSDELKGQSIEVMHLNTPSNRWFHETKAEGTLAGIAHKFVRHGEKESHEQNIDGLGKYGEWIRKDFGLTESIFRASNPNPSATSGRTTAAQRNQAPCQQRINDALVRMAKATDDLKGATTPREKAEFKNAIKKEQAALTAARAEMRAALKEDYKRIGSLIEDVKGPDYISKHGPIKSKNAVVALQLYKQLLSSQLEFTDPPMDRGQEGMIIQQLNNKLGVSAAMNCKSGLDRTGLWHAVKIGMENTEKLDKSPDKKLFNEMISKWHDLTMDMNKYLAYEGKTGYKRTLEGYINAGNTPEDQALRAMVGRYRNEIAKSLIVTGIPVTQRSTGLLGLKWNPGGMSENRVPLNFLPPAVVMKDEKGKLVEVKLVVYNKKTGEPEKLTKEGRELFTKMSGLRGS